MALPLVTERLLVRRYTLRDVPDVLEFVSQPSLADVIAERIEPTEEGVRKYIELQTSYQHFEKGKVFELAIERKSDGKVIGLVGMICDARQQGEIGWALGAEHRGQGFATEAAKALMEYGFRALGLQRIFADCAPGNLNSLRVMTRLGMRQEALPTDSDCGGTPSIDKHVYSLLASDWCAAQG